MTTRLAHSITLAVVVTFAGNAAAHQDSIARGIVPVYMTVIDRAGVDVVDLRAEEITLSANGKPVPIVSVSRDSRPLSMVVILDTSKSLAVRFEAIRLVAAGFLSQLRPADRARVGGFSDTIQFSDAFRTNPTALISALGALKGGSPTRLYDALIESADLLKAESGRRIVVVLSDGEDTSSRSSFSKALEALHAHHVTAYSVGVEAVFSEGGRLVRVRPHRDLTRFADETGGGYFQITQSIDLKGEILRSMHEMRNPYLLTFVPPVLDGKSYKLVVQTARAGVTTRARKEYVARP